VKLSGFPGAVAVSEGQVPEPRGGHVLPLLVETCAPSCATSSTRARRVQTAWRFQGPGRRAGDQVQRRAVVEDGESHARTNHDRRPRHGARDVPDARPRQPATPGGGSTRSTRSGPAAARAGGQPPREPTHRPPDRSGSEPVPARPRGSRPAESEPGRRGPEVRQTRSAPGPASLGTTAHACPTPFGGRQVEATPTSNRAGWVSSPRAVPNADRILTAGGGWCVRQWAPSRSSVRGTGRARRW
jgi:hypothetical protein